MIENFNKKEIVDWIKVWTREYGLQFCYLPIFGLHLDIIQYNLENFITVPEGKMQSLYIDRNDLDKINKAVETYYFDDLRKIESFKNDFILCGENLTQKTKLLAENIENISDAELVNRYNTFLDEFIKYGKFLWVTFLLNEIMSKVLVETIDRLKISDHQKSELTEYAIKPSRPSGILLLQKLSKVENINNLKKRFAWLTMLDFHNDPADQNDIENRIIGASYIEPVEPKILEDLDTKTKEIILYSRDTTFMKDMRDDYRRMAVFESIPIYNQIAKRLNIERKQVSYLSKEEIIEGLVSKVSKTDLIDKINNRKDTGFIFGIFDSKNTLIDDSTIIEKFIEENKLNQKSDDLKITTIKGISGSKGCVLGKIRIIKSIKESDLIQNGEILCVVTTNPDYLPFMQKASAFITDEGGITCHAAIIAREMKKPCIVGTKIATKVLKDGDLVEVDADNGVVRILEK